MCGVAGWLGTLPNGELHSANMIKALQHRGPNAHGIRSWPEATLVHTRLRILDLSEGGAQPMPNEDKTVWTVFNGELYNHRQIRHRLQSKGHAFRGRSDTEVLPHLYEEDGVHFLQELRGMFALAIYDSRAQTLILARDRFGIKPLYYAITPNYLAFASEIPPLLTLPGIDTKPNRQAIYDLATLYFIPGPQTFHSGIQCLEPGQILEAQCMHHEITWKTGSYHRWAVTPNPELTLVKATDQAEELISQAVRGQLESDVPLGALLSGGIDSSLVSAAAQSPLHGRRLRTFNVRFPETRYDETWAATAVADHIKSQHETLDMSDVPGTWDTISELLLHVGQPFADTSLFAVNAVCQLMKQHVIVVLTGDGGDEGFGGYRLYWRIARIVQLQQLPSIFWATAGKALSPLSRWGLVSSHSASRIQSLAGADDTTIIQSMYCHLNESDQNSLCRETDLLPTRRLFEQKWANYLYAKASRTERILAHATEVNTRMKLPDDFLFKVDMASMKHSLELRVPMLDEDIFSFGLSLPHHLKVAGQEGKLVLRAVAARQLPRAITTKPKQGFNIPVDAWVDAEFKAQLKDIALDPQARVTEYFSPEWYQPRILAFCEGKLYPGFSRQQLYRLAIMVLSIELHLARAQRRAP